MVRQALFDTEGPVAVRYPRGSEGRFREDSSSKPIVRLREGADVTLVGYGIQINHLLDAADRLAEDGIQTEVVKLNRISPLIHDEVCAELGSRKILLVLEDAFGVGCVGQRLAAILAEHKQSPKQMILKNLEKTFAPAGSVAELEHSFGLDAESLAEAVWEAREHG